MARHRPAPQRVAVAGLAGSVAVEHRAQLGRRPPVVGVAVPAVLLGVVVVAVTLAPTDNCSRPQSLWDGCDTSAGRAELTICAVRMATVSAITSGGI